MRNPGRRDVVSAVLLGTLGVAATALSAAPSRTQFTHMYQAHAAREDTVLFPAFRSLFAAKDFEALGDRFEEQEHRLLGGDGFEKALDEVAQLERTLGIHDLAGFTPRT